MSTLASQAAAAVLAAAYAVAAVDAIRLRGGETDAELPALVVLGLLALVANLALRGQALPGALRGPTIALVVLTGWLLFAAAVASDPLLSVWAVVVYAVLGIATARLAVAGSWRTVCVSVVAGFAIFVAGSLFVATFVDVAMRFERRLQLLSLDPNQLSRFAGLAAIAALVLAFTERSSEVAARAGWLVVAGSCIGAAAWSGSRTGALALAAALIFLAWAWLDRRAVAVGVIVIGAFSLLAAPAQVGEVLSDTLGREIAIADLGSVAGRTETWRVAADEARDAPFVGVGPLGDDEVYAEARLDGRIGWDARNAHALWAHLLVVGGLPALFAGLAMVAAYIVVAARRLRPGIDAMVVLILVDGLNEAVLTTPNASSALLAAAVIVRGIDASRRALPAPGDPLVEAGALGTDGGVVPVPG